VISTRIGVGLKPLHGLLTCGQFEITASASISARSATWQPGGEIADAIAAPPSSVTGTRMTVLCQFPDAEVMEQLAMGMEQGMSIAIGQIDAVLEPVPAA